MAKSDKNPEPTDGSGCHEMRFLPDRPVWLVSLLLLLAAAGAIIAWLFGSLGAALGACFWALWAAAALAIAAALVKHIGALRAKRHQEESEPPPPEQKNPESIPKTEKPAAELKGERTRRSQRWVFTIERITDEKKAEPLRSFEQILRDGLQARLCGAGRRRRATTILIHTLAR